MLCLLGSAVHTESLSKGQTLTWGSCPRYWRTGSTKDSNRHFSFHPVPQDHILLHSADGIYIFNRFWHDVLLDWKMAQLWPQASYYNMTRHFILLQEQKSIFSLLQNTFEDFSLKDIIMLPPFDVPYVVVQVLCRLCQSAEICKDGFPGPSLIFTYFSHMKHYAISWSYIKIHEHTDNFIVFYQSCKNNKSNKKFITHWKKGVPHKI